MMVRVLLWKELINEKSLFKTLSNRIYKIVLWSTCQIIGRYTYLQRYMLLDNFDGCNAYHMSKSSKHTHILFEMVLIRFDKFEPEATYKRGVYKKNNV